MERPRPQKKRDFKAGDKGEKGDKGDRKQKERNWSRGAMNRSKGTVDFMQRDPSKKKPAFGKKKEGFKGSSPKIIGKKRPDKEEGASKAKLRREKYKVSELIKKLRINYNKLLMKKKDMGETVEQKAGIVKDTMALIGDKYNELIYKHDGCRIIQALIKHGSAEQKTHVLEQIKGNMV